MLIIQNTVAAVRTKCTSFRTAIISEVIVSVAIVTCFAVVVIANAIAAVSSSCTIGLAGTFAISIVVVGFAVIANFTIGYDTIAAAQTKQTLGRAGTLAIGRIGIGAAVIALFAAICNVITAVRCRLTGIETGTNTISRGFVGLAVIAGFVFGIEHAITAICGPLAFGITLLFWRFAVSVDVAIHTIITGFTGLNETITTGGEFTCCRALTVVIVFNTAIAFFIKLGLNNAIAASHQLATSRTAIST